MIYTLISPYPLKSVKYEFLDLHLLKLQELQCINGCFTFSLQLAKFIDYYIILQFLRCYKEKPYLVDSFN